PDVLAPDREAPDRESEAPPPSRVSADLSPSTRRSDDGETRSAAAGTRSESLALRATSNVTLAVMPGSRSPSGVFASTLTGYVATLLTVVDARRSCETSPGNERSG